MIVEDYDRKGNSLLYGSYKLLAGHQERGVPNHYNDFSVRQSQLRAETCGNLEPHRGVAILHEVALPLRVLVSPQAVEIAWKTARGVNHHRLIVDMTIDHVNCRSLVHGHTIACEPGL